MKRKYKVKESGYLSVLRDIQGLLQNKTMNFTLLGAYICFVFQADWDRRHENYRAILPNDEDMSKLFGCNVSTIYRNRKKLLDKGLLENIRGDTYIKNLDLFNVTTIKLLAKKECRIADLHIYYAKPEIELSKIMIETDNMQ